MRTFKLILGIGCLLVAINFGLFVLGGFDWPFVVCALSLTGVGLFLISKRNLPLLWKARILIVVNFVFIGGLIVLFVIPSFVRAGIKLQPMLASTTFARLMLPNRNGPWR